MEQKAKYRSYIRIITAILMLCAVFAAVPNQGAYVHAASAKAKFAASVKNSVLKKAKKAGATAGSKIGVVKVVNYTNVYKKASIYSKEVGRLYKGTGVYIIKKGHSLSYISSGSAKGWVKNKCLLTGKAAGKYYKAEAPRVATLRKYKQINVREKPAVSSAKIAYIKKGESLVIAKETGSWLQVRLVNFSNKLSKANEYKYGYINKSLVKVESGLCKGITVTAENKRKARITKAKAEETKPQETKPEKETEGPSEKESESQTADVINPPAESDENIVKYKYVKAEEVDDIEHSATYKKVQAQCKWTGTVLNQSNGRIQGPNGEETYYNDGTHDSLVNTMKRRGLIAQTDRTWVRSDGVRMLGNYVMVAADINRTNIGHKGLRPLGTIYETSLGIAIVCDTGGFALNNPTQTDIHVTW